MEELNTAEDRAPDEAIINLMKLLSVEITEHRRKKIRDLLDVCRERLHIDYLIKLLP